MGIKVLLEPLAIDMILCTAYRTSNKVNYCFDADVDNSAILPHSCLSLMLGDPVIVSLL